MKKIFYYFLPVLAILVLSGCGGNKADEKSFVIHGKLTNTKKDSIYLKELTTKSAIGIDSAILTEDGEFYFRVKPKEIGFYILKLSSDNFITLLIDKKEDVEITGDAKQLSLTYNVTGSSGSVLLMELNAHKQKSLGRVDSLSAVYSVSKGKPDILKIKAELDSVYKVIFMNEKAFLQKFIDQNTSSLACLIAIYQQFGREMMFNTSSSDDFIYFDKLDKALFDAYPGNMHASDFHERVAEIRKINAEKAIAEARLGIGAVAPDFTLSTPEGKEVSLSSFRGTNVLIDFWASWCAPCRQLNPEMVRLYKQYKDKNFTILGVSLDKEKDAWTKAIKQDKLTWTQVSELKYWNSSVVKLYNIAEIPYSVLIDTDGKIVCKGLKGDSLAAKVAEIVK
jgi:peroxiredoxin